ESFLLALRGAKDDGAEVARVTPVHAGNLFPVGYRLAEQVVGLVWLGIGSLATQKSSGERWLTEPASTRWQRYALRPSGCFGSAHAAPPVVSENRKAIVTANSTLRRQGF